MAGDVSANKHKTSWDSAMKNTQPKWIRKILGGTGIALALFWGFAEGTFFFIVPDLIISFVAIFDIKKSLRHIIAVLIGSLLAGTLMYYSAASNFKEMTSAVLKVPFVTDKMNEQVKKDFEKYGCWALCVGPTSGIPYKLYAINAPKYISFSSFAIITIPARIERLILTWFMFSVLGIVLNRRRKNKTLTGTIIFAVYWIAVYIIYWS